MTLWYLIGTFVVLGLALLTVTGTGGPAPALIIWIGRILPAIAALFACVAFCLVVTRSHLSILAAVFFCLPLLALSLLPVLPHVASARNSNLSVMLTTVAPVLTIFPAMALWHLASASKRRGR